VNIVILQGRLVAAPLGRLLASGATVSQFDLRTTVGDGIVTVPVAWFDPPASSALEAGDEVVVAGTVQRRFFRAGGSTQSRAGVVARSVVRASNRRAVAKLRSEALATVEAG
jgi:single-strand DNA-binding protein